jgi:membrane protein DedA with SNARE-associated domain
MLLASTGSQGADLDGVAGWAVDLMEKLGAPGAGLAIALENLFPPLPSELILPLAGFTASRGDFSFAGALFWTTMGSLVGALVMYAAGAVFGRRRLYAVWAKVPLLKTEDLERTEAWFARHGKATVFFGRMIPIFRSLISIPAGVERMPLLTFVVLTTLGSLVWNTVFVTAGYTLGEQWHRVEAYANTFQTVVIGAVLLVFALFVVVRVRSLRAER